MLESLVEKVVQIFETHRFVTFIYYKCSSTLLLFIDFDKVLLFPEIDWHFYFLSLICRCLHLFFQIRYE